MALCILARDMRMVKDRVIEVEISQKSQQRAVLYDSGAA